MAKMTREIIEDLYSFGKDVYNNEIDLYAAIEAVKTNHPGKIAHASASFYIGLVSEYIRGRKNTWNQNSDLVLYYVEAITKDFGIETGEKAYQAGIGFAEAKGRTTLKKDLNTLWETISTEDSQNDYLNEAAFEQWMRSNGDKEYTDNTICRYIRALKKAEEWLGIELPVKVLSINDLSTLNEAEKIIKRTPDYSSINQNHGHGDLSAALGAYRKFLNSKDSEVADHKSWLLTWNPANYKFSHYEEVRQQVLSGEKYVEEWACANTHVEIGDRVYLMRLGSGRKNGIIASGHAVRTSYLVPHYNPERAAAGETIPKIDVEFDCFLDRNGSGFLHQNVLESMFPSQRWNPQGSGIQIKEYYVAPLEAEWQKYMDVADSSTKKSLGIFDSWEIVDENTAIKTCDKSFYEYNGSGVPKGICWFFGAENLQPGEKKSVTLIYKGIGYSARVVRGATGTKNVTIDWLSDLGDQFKAIRKDETQKLKFIKNGDSYSISFGGERPMPTTKEAVSGIKEYITSRGFSYPDGMIENFYLSLKSKPFVILAGTSGTGKTRLVKLFAEAIGAEYFLVPVRPDWSDGSDLFGHNDLSGNFVDGPICPAFEAAKKNPDRPVLICLDEMNLARVEYYLSDFLSVIESREKQPDGSIKTVGIAQYDEGIPSNIYIIGTVNMDETTFPFSKKVLDRANTIEFNYVDLAPTFDAASPDTNPIKLPNTMLRAEYLVLVRDCFENKEYVQGVCDDLEKINKILKKANAHVGYRVRDEIVFYMLNNRKEDNLLTEDEAMDNEILQKILPRIQGSSAAIKDMLVDLFKFCIADRSGIDSESGHAGHDMQNLADSAKYPNSARKIGFMMTRFEEDGFTSYWL